MRDGADKPGKPERAGLRMDPSSADSGRLDRAEDECMETRKELRHVSEQLDETRKKLQAAEEALRDMQSRFNAQVQKLHQAKSQAENETLRLEAVMEALPVGVAITDLQGGTIQSNAEFKRVWGENLPRTLAVKDYARYKAWWTDTEQRVEPEEWASARAVRERATVAGQRIEIQKFDGQRAQVLNSAAPIRDGEGNVIGSAVVIQDVTRLYDAEKELKQLNLQLSRRVGDQDSEIRSAYEAVKSERKRLYDVLDTLPVYLILLTPDYHVAFANRYFRERFGESEGRHCYEYLFNKTAPCENCQTYDVLNGDHPKRWEWPGPDGCIYDVHDFPFADSDGAPLILEMGIDITAIKRAEAELRDANELLEQRVAERTMALAESEARLARAQEIAHMGSWEINLENNELTWSDEVYRIFGAEPKEFIPTYERFLDRIPAGDREATHAAYSESLREGTDGYEIEHRIIGLKTGAIRWVHEKCQHIRNSDGKILRSIGMVSDITERKLMEEALARKHEELQTMIDSVRAWIFYKDRQNRFLRVNKAMADALNASREQLEGKSIFDLYSAGQAEAYWKDDLEVIASRKAKLGIVESVDVQGDRLWVQTDKFPYLDDQGIVVGVIGLSLDITQRKRIEEALEQSMRRFELLARTAEELLRSTNPQKVVESLCRRVMEHLDCQAFFNFLVDEESGKLRLNACLGIPPGDIQDIGVLEKGVAICGCVALEGRRIVAEHILSTEDERTRLVKSYGLRAYACHPLLAQDGKVIGTLSFGTRTRDTFSIDDLSLMKAVADQVAVALMRMQGEQALRRTAEELTRSNRDLEQFAYVSSHDLREPLRTVTGFVQILQERYRDKLDARANEYINFTVEGAKRMQQLIDDLLAYSRVGSQILIKPWNTQESLDRALSFLKGSIEEAHAKITCDPLPTIQADGKLLAQVFQNLIGNAIKFRSEQPLEIHIGARREKDAWLFSVRDNGIGMSREYSEAIFIIFKRLHTRDKYPGTGIGLSICKKIVEQHGGKIWVESEPGGGSTFYFTIADKKE